MFYTIVDGAGNVVAAGEGNAPPANALVLPGETAQSLIGYAQNNSAPNANDGTQWQAQIFNHLSANLIKVLGDGDVDLLPRTDDQLLTAFKNIIAANVEQITPASVIAGLTALRTETYRPGYRAGGDYVLGGGDADRGAYAGQQWQVINADNTLGDRYFWVNGAGATAADRRNAGRWRIMSGSPAVQIWGRGEAANGAGSAGELRNIPERLPAMLAQARRRKSNGASAIFAACIFIRLIRERVLLTAPKIKSRRCASRRRLLLRGKNFLQRLTTCTQPPSPGAGDSTFTETHGASSEVRCCRSE